MLIASYGNPASDPLSRNRCKDLLKSNAAYVAAPSVSLYLQHFKRFAGDHVASTKLLQDRPAPKRGHFKTVYSAEALCWVCGSASHDPRDCKMLTSVLRLQVQAPPQGQLSRQRTQLHFTRPPLWSRGSYFTQQSVRAPRQQQRAWRAPRQQQRAWRAPRRAQRQALQEQPARSQERELPAQRHSRR